MMRRDIINVAILWFTLTFIVELLQPLFPLPPEFATESVISDDSFRILLVLGLPVFTFVVAVLGYSLWKFRATGDAPEESVPVHGNTWVSGIWLTVTGGLCLLVIVHPGLTSLAKFASNNQQDLTVKIVGRQWTWDVEYPNEGITGVAEIVVPVNKRVKFEVTSSDILHSFWIPAFRNKIDAIPGRVTAMYVTPTQLGTFDQIPTLRVQCAELCGMQHSKMTAPVRVVSQTDFDAWVQQQAPSQDPIARGASLAKSKGCAACHSTDGTKIVGPTWKDLYGSDVALADGKTVKADDAYLHESILSPNAKIVSGFNPDIMPPSFGTTLTTEQIGDLVSYVKSVSATGNHINADLSEYKIALSTTQAKAGELTFTIKNISKTMMHEMIMVKTDLAPDKLPLNADGDVDEDKLTEDPAAATGDMLLKVGALEDIEQGKGGDVTVNLAPGHYVFFCNKPAHYKQGMYVEFNVTP